ncbi:C-type lectin-related protein 2 [Elysia marginata]|uniref:C-type lectin-related protein 2 n=1 Tax=Elysia marginata TaxID=1093978 RepID=A0AAV4GSD8_9GAST|nr:C-type lectin-related protein 2 [Elysia marginata]
MYNSDTGLCTPASFLKSGRLGEALAPNSTEGDLYAQSTCNPSDGFSLVTYGNETACIWISNFQLTYYDAQAFCVDRGAHLYVARSMEGLHLFLESKYVCYIIGLKSNDNAGDTFVWQDNGNEITYDFRNLLINEGKPRYYEQCVIIGECKFKFASKIDCREDQYNFVCQRPML